MEDSKTQGFLSNTKRAFKISEIIQSLEEDKIAYKTFLSDLASVNTDDDELHDLISRLRNKLTASSSSSNREKVAAAKWKEVLSDLLSEKRSEPARQFVKELSELLD